MTIGTITKEGQSYKYALLKLKEGQMMITFDGRLISEAYLAILNINAIEERFSFIENWQLAVWESTAKYKGFMLDQEYCHFVNEFALHFNGSGQSVPVAVLNSLNYNFVFRKFMFIDNSYWSYIK